MNEPDRQFSLEELSTLTGTPVRTIRFYIQQGLVPRPEGVARGAHYGPAHLEALLSISRWQKAGVSLARIRELLEGAEVEVPIRRAAPGTVEVRTHLVVGPGVELVIEPGQAGLSPEKTRVLFRETLEIYRHLAADREDRS
jgi:DNA-binding transcriptional MerR regulator